jgi:hypothetical protein
LVGDFCSAHPKTFCDAHGSRLFAFVGFAFGAGLRAPFDACGPFLFLSASLAIWRDPAWGGSSSAYAVQTSSLQRGAEKRARVVQVASWMGSFIRCCAMGSAARGIEKQVIEHRNRSARGGVILGTFNFWALNSRT